MISLYDSTSGKKFNCECCGKYDRNLERHHIFSQTVWAKKLYGKLLDDHRNILKVCNGCNGSHANPNLLHWDEMDFCRALEIQPRSKINRGKII